MIHLFEENKSINLLGEKYVGFTDGLVRSHQDVRDLSRCQRCCRLGCFDIMLSSGRKQLRMGRESEGQDQRSRCSLAAFVSSEKQEH